MSIDIEKLKKEYDVYGQISRAETDNLIAAFEQQKTEIERLENKLEEVFPMMYYAIADMRHVGCRGEDTQESMRTDLNKKFDKYHQQLNDFCKPPEANNE